ncbi:MAG TPA: TolC family protein [Bryobacteraceae bacterium]|nr:TolC family protein [Bryobacteraceae bacterium]
MRPLPLTLSVGLVLSTVLSAQPAPAAQPVPGPSATSGQPLTLTFAEALARARQYGVDLQTANIAALLAREDRIQAKAALLPQTQQVDEFIYTQPNGTPSGVFVPNDGPHIYYVYAQAHEDLSFAHRAEYRRAQAAEALAQAKADLAARGLFGTFAQDYYGLVIAQRKLANAEQSLRDAQAFQDITEKQERGGEAAHADVIKAQLQTQQRERDLADARLAIEKARLTLAVLLFPDFQQNFSVIDDIEQAPPLESFDQVRQEAQAKSPELRIAQASVKQESAGLSAARAAYLPSPFFDYFYGIQANQLALYNRDHQNNLGSVFDVGVNIPLWTWGATQSKVRQARLREQQANVELGFAQRQLQANLSAAYAEAQAARIQLDSLRSSLSLAAESLRLTTLRYQAGEATALEVVDAQTTLAAARNALDDGLSRYRIAIAALQSLTGNF